MGNLVEAIENHDPYPDGEDIELFRHVTGKEITKIGGNSLVGYTKFKPIDLIMTFGLPTESDSYKYSGSYIFQHRSGDYLQIYDWKINLCQQDLYKSNYFYTTLFQECHSNNSHNYSA